MRVISVKASTEFWVSHRDSERHLRFWHKATKSAAWKSLADVRKTFGSADTYKHFTIFNIGGNKYRLIVAIHYNTQRVYVRYILTHAEYDRGNWKK
jgi:mRNA interferase HigB